MLQLLGRPIDDIAHVEHTTAAAEEYLHREILRPYVGLIVQAITGKPPRWNDGSGAEPVPMGEIIDEP